MTREKFIQIIEPTVEQHSLLQFDQLKAFVDNSLKEVASKNFESAEDKIRYLIGSLQSIRDFSVALTTENSMRLSMIKQFNKLEEELTLGNESNKQEEKSLQRQGENQVQGQLS